jgi:hypothetical protein
VSGDARAASPAGDRDGAPSAALWPDVEVSVRYGWLVARWIATSRHPEAGTVRGWGLSRAGALRSLGRRIRRR